MGRALRRSAAPFPSTNLELTTMKQETVRATAFAMPMTNPAFSPGPYIGAA
jgi:hypothetical protein